MLLPAVIAFVKYFFTAIFLLGAFVAVYVHLTPYREFALIRQGNVAAAAALAGAVLGFVFPLMASIYYTQSLTEMCIWACVTCLVQFVVFLCLRSQAREIESGNLAAGITVATFSIAAGLLNAISISH
jgi:putative membrane protein